ncbi:ThiF family adenylyltransferase [Microbacterium sp. GXF0217]
MSGALIAPAAPLDDAARSRYARQIALPGFGELGQRRLAAARVLVIGAGGLGTPVLAALAAAGVGTIGIVDDDVVEVANLHRQLLHGTGDVGRAKTTSAHEAMSEINPHVRVQERRVRLSDRNAERILADYDVVVDGSDNFATRYLVADAAERLGIPTVWGAVLGYTGQVSVFWPPHGPSYRDLHPDVPDAAATCATGGVLGMACHAIGAMMAAETVKLITGVGDALLGRIMLLDALDATWRTFSVVPDPSRTAGPNMSLLADRSPTIGQAGGSGCRAGVGAGAGAGATAVLPSALAAELAGGRAPIVIDVREPHETDGILAGSLRIPLAEVAGSPPKALAPTDAVVLVCASGVRAQRAAGLLVDRGFRDVRWLTGSVSAVQI